MDKIDSELQSALLELERRKKVTPQKFYEPANKKIEAFHRSNATVRALFGGNRSGKTEAAMMEATWRLLGEHPYQEVPPPPVYGRIVVVDYNQLEKVVCEKLARMLPPESFIDGKWERSYNSRTHILTLRNGSKVDFMTHDQDLLSFEGSSRDFTIFDEEPPKDIYTSCILRHVDRNGKTIFSMTPLAGLTFTYNEVYLASFSNPNIDAWTMSTYENRYLSAEAISKIEELVEDEIDKEIRLKGKFLSRTGLVFSNFDPDIHVYDPNSEVFSDWDDFYPPSYYIHIVGIDPGWGHPTGIVWMAMNPNNGEKYIYAEHKEAGQTPDYYSKIIKAKNAQMGKLKPIYVIDSQAKAKEHSSGSSSFQRYAKCGINCRLGTKKLIDGNMALNESLRPIKYGDAKLASTFISNECSQLISEIGLYQRAPDTTLQNRERFIDKNNDLISAWRYANWVCDKLDYNDLEDYVSISTPKRRGSPTTGY